MAQTSNKQSSSNTSQPHIKIEGATRQRPQQSSSSAQKKETGKVRDYEKSGSEARSRAIEAKDSATAWLEGFMPGHGNAIFFGILFLILALVIIWLGFFPALFIALLVIVGVAFGQWLDGKPTILDSVKRAFKNSGN